MNRKDAELLAKEAFIYDGYNVKTVQMRSDRIDTRYWSLGEEWEKNFTQLQNLPPRHCFVKHKIQGGIISLETEDIEPAYKDLDMNPEQFAEYVANLPFGRKYLIDRSSITQPQPQPQTAQPTKESKKAQPTSTPAQQDQPSKPVVVEVKPQLEEQQQAFLEYVIANPETPSSGLSKALQVSVWKAKQIRDELKAQGLIAELETRLGRAGRRTIFLIPTFAGLEIVGKEPPAGRGGAVHRHIQHLIEEGAVANGFTAQCEYDLGNGGIVDVHLEKGDIRIAVEIAVASRPSREIAHIKHCLAVGYDRVFNIFADDKMQQKTQEALDDGFSDEERAKVQLLHLSKLSDMIYNIVSLTGGRVTLPAELAQEV
jgi:hypothetical protein